jgi:mannose-6-phosphate isomerase-like protein (cupin superfamily)
VANTDVRIFPKPVFDGPAQIKEDSAIRFIWGDAESGEVTDWVYVSSKLIHALVFGLEPGGAFRHSPEYRTVYGCDELFHVLQGVMGIANPATGEVHRVAAGESIFFRRETWHHVFAHGPGPLRVLEILAPPPITKGEPGADETIVPYLTTSIYGQDELIRHLLPASPRSATMHRLTNESLVWRRDLGVLVGLLASTEHLTVGVIDVDPGRAATSHTHGGDEILYVIEGSMHVRVRRGNQIDAFDLRPHDACYLPIGSRHDYRNFGESTARAIFGVAPSYLETSGADFH